MTCGYVRKYVNEIFFFAIVISAICSNFPTLWSTFSCTILFANKNYACNFIVSPYKTMCTPNVSVTWICNYLQFDCFWSRAWIGQNQEKYQRSALLVFFREIRASPVTKSKKSSGWLFCLTASFIVPSDGRGSHSDDLSESVPDSPHKTPVLWKAFSYRDVTMP